MPCFSLFDVLFHINVLNFIFFFNLASGADRFGEEAEVCLEGT